MAPSFWRTRRVFVTGGTGLVGSWLVRRLLVHGAHVLALVRHESARSCASLSGCAVVRGSLTDAAFLQRTLAEYQPQTVFHLAGQSQVREAQEVPVATLETNVQGTWNLLEACRKATVGQVVQSSSGQVYGTVSAPHHDEASPLLAREPYQVSKQCAELIARMYAYNYDLPIGIIRSCNTFGGGDSNFARMIPGVIRETYFGRRFTIRGDGRSLRHYLYVEDAVDAYLLLAQTLHDDRSLAGEAFNVSFQQNYSVIDVVNRILGIMQRQDLVPVIQNTTMSETREQPMGTEKARERLSWSPRTSMEEGLALTVAWYRQHFRSNAETHSQPPAIAGTALLRSTYEDADLSRGLAL